MRGEGTLVGIWVWIDTIRPAGQAFSHNPFLRPRSCAVVGVPLCLEFCDLMLIPMSPTDSVFLLAESENCQMQVGGLALFSPPEGARASDVRDMFAAAVARDKVAGVWRKRARRSVTSLGQWGWDRGAEVDLDTAGNADSPRPEVEMHSPPSRDALGVQADLVAVNRHQRKVGVVPREPDR